MRLLWICRCECSKTLCEEITFLLDRQKTKELQKSWPESLFLLVCWVLPFLLGPSPAWPWPLPILERSRNKFWGWVGSCPKQRATAPVIYTFWFPVWKCCQYRRCDNDTCPWSQLPVSPPGVCPLPRQPPAPASVPADHLSSDLSFHQSSLFFIFYRFNDQRPFMVEKSGINLIVLPNPDMHWLRL